MSTPKREEKPNDNDNIRDILDKKFNSKIVEYGNGLRTIDGIHVVEQFYHAYLANGTNLSNKKKMKKEIYKYILDNNLKVVGGKFDKHRICVRFIYYCTF